MRRAELMPLPHEGQMIRDAIDVVSGQLHNSDHWDSERWSADMTYNQYINSVIHEAIAAAYARGRAEIHAALLRAEVALHNAASAAGQQAEVLEAASLEAYKIRDK
jgi:hypothetical protein